MKRWFTSDIHFKHRNIIPYCKRPWENVEIMDEAIIEQWNSQVAPEDEVYMLGDFSINKRNAIKESLVKSLNGKKHIVLGNHDIGFNTLHKNPETEKTLNSYKKAGWESVSVIKYLTLKDRTEVVMTHLPPDNSNDNRYSQYKVVNNPAFNYLHGHLHGHYRKKDNMIDVCFDGELRLLTEDEVIALIHDERKFIPTRLTEFYKTTNPIMLKPFEEEVQNKNVRRFESDCGKLVGYNYTEQCTFDKNWNDITRNSRGIVFEKATGKLVALPFPKFFNLGEMPETRLENLPNEPYSCLEKMDGSLGILYFYDGEWRMNTRGSFHSDQAKRGLEIFNSKYDFHFFNRDYTYLVEIIYPENKIVVNYEDREMLSLLAIVNTKEMKEIIVPSLEVMPEVIAGGLDFAHQYNHSIEEMLDLQKYITKDEEGFVVRFKSGLRVKIKGDEYLKVHRLISQISPLSFWGCMEAGDVNTDYLKELPEEYREEVDNIVKVLEDRYLAVLQEAKYEMDMCISEVGFGNLDCKDYARKVGLYVKNNKVKHGSAIFSMFKGQVGRLDNYIMKKIRPDGNVL